MINIERIKNTDKTIWRYMDLWKFESMLEDNGCLYFTRSDMFYDKLEGKYSDITLKNLEDKYLKLHGETFVKNWRALYYSKGDYRACILAFCLFCNQTSATHINRSN